MPRRRVMLACCCLPLLAPVLLAVAEPGSSPAKAPPKPKEQLVGPDAARPTEPAHAGDAPASSSSSPSSTSSVALLTATPKGALKLLAAALRDGDADRIRQVMYASNASEARMVAAMADMAKAMASLQRSAVKAFGREWDEVFAEDLASRRELNIFDPASAKADERQAFEAFVADMVEAICELAA